ncbi:hypothetical protein TIFTF001_020643 [Ficus carica]|uniref:Uncharacterized protein n=1 Tax=Ficus carica TaxID=3494 RepID=A0AA88AU91_FICCA|nr:hypothetical protein TIFTF001_020643 [Ficus carica]
MLLLTRSSLRPHGVDRWREPVGLLNERGGARGRIRSYWDAKHAIWRGLRHLTRDRAALGATCGIHSRSDLTAGMASDTHDRVARVVDVNKMNVG